MLSIDEINQLKAHNDGLREQNKNLQADSIRMRESLEKILNIEPSSFNIYKKMIAEIKKIAKEALTAEEFKTRKSLLVARLKECAENDDWESAHGDADDALIEFINDKEISDAFEQVGKWYA